MNSGKTKVTDLLDKEEMMIGMTSGALPHEATHLEVAILIDQNNTWFLCACVSDRIAQIRRYEH